MAKQKTNKPLSTRVANSIFAIGIASMAIALVATFSPTLRSSLHAFVTDFPATASASDATPKSE